LREFEAFESQRHAKKNLLRAVEAVAGILGNTTAVCRKSYIHPAVIDSYMDGTMIEILAKRVGNAGRKRAGGLRPDEATVLSLLQQRLAREARKRKAAA
jgi:DNA topoisomerase-1